MGKYDALFDLNMRIQDWGGKFLSLKRIMYLQREKNVLINNANLAQYKKFETCYILGLGPSLKEIDLSKLNGDSIATNRFYKFEGNLLTEPNFYIMMDNDFFLKKEQHCLIDARSRFPKSAFVLNGRYHKESQTLIGKEKNFFMYSWKGMFSGEEIELTKVLPVFGNIVCCAIGLAMGLKYKRIILLGCDFNSFATPKVVHCYTENKNDPKLRSLAMELFCYSFEAEMHNRLENYARKRGIEILNGTPGSLIDSYPFLSEKEQSEINR